MSRKNFMGIDFAGGPNLTPEGQLTLQDGSAAAPAASFLSDPSTGFYKSGTAIQTSIAGSTVSTQSASSLALAGALTTSGSIGASGSISCGTNSFHCGPLTSGAGLLVGGSYGFPTQPTVAFTGNTNSGFYDDGGTAIGVSVGGSKVASWGSVGLNLLAKQLNCGPIVCSSSVSAGSITASGVVQCPAGSATAPSLLFGSSDTTTGIYHNGAATTSFAGSGAEVFRVGASQIQAFQPISTGTNTISCGAMTCGAMSCSSLTSTGTVSCGTNAMTCGALSSGAHSASSLTVGTGGSTVALIQVGTAAVGANGGGSASITVTITFGTAFASTPRVFGTMQNQASSSFSDCLTCTLRSVSTTTAVFNVTRCDSPAGAWTQQAQLEWMAIG